MATVLALIVVALMSSCGQNQATPIPNTETPTITPGVANSTATIQPTATPTDIPAAAIVNGEVIPLAEYQAELARFRAAAAQVESPPDESVVIHSMIDDLLLAQGARQAGFNVNDEMISQRINQLDIGEQELQAWLEQHYYTEESFRQALSRTIAAAWMRDQIADQVPMEAEQIHAQQILLYNLDEAQQIYEQLSAGADFETLARQIDPLTKGDLGWFPPGYLLQSELNEVVSNLQPGEYSQIIETEIGYHIIKVIEKGTHPLTFNTRLFLQKQAVEAWLEEQRSQSNIVIMVP